MAPSSPRDLSAARREFITHFSPRFLLSWLAVALVVRVIVGQWSWTNVVVLVVVIASQPFVEWVIHVFLLHARPRKVFGREIDTIVAQDHRAHHQDPRDIPLIFIPRRWLMYLFVGSTVISLLIPGMGNKATAWFVTSAAALVYEWTHFLIHTDYKPKTRIFRHIYNSHRWHHYRNEQYWFGVTSDIGDRVLGTAPDKDEVPVSKTARNLADSPRVRPRRVS